MRELLETLRNTDTHMSISPNEIGILVSFVHYNAGDPKKYEFMISDVDLAYMRQVFDVEKYIMLKLNWFLDQLGIKM